MERRQYDVIKSLLKSEVPATKYIATLIVQELADKRQLILSVEDSKAIKSNYESTEEFKFCDACIISINITVGEALRQNPAEPRALIYIDEIGEWVNQNLWH